MKKVRSFINVVLGSLVAALGLNGCDTPQQIELVKYGVPYVDTTMDCMYGVPSPQIIDWNEETDTDNENK